VVQINLSTPDGDSLIDNLRSSGFVALIGSAVSMFEPANLPSGLAVTNALATLLAAPVRSHRRTIEKLIQNCAFEHILESCPERERIGDNLMDFYGAGRPNTLHELIAALTKDGIIRHVITTNYDTCIEQAFNTAGVAYDLVLSESDSKTFSGRPIIFKVHGCAGADLSRGPNSPRSMIYTLAGEGILPRWKRDLLGSLLAGSSLLVCGYSGLDFELCPEIATRRPRVIWNARPNRSGMPELRDNATRVVEETNGTILCADMTDLISRLARRPCPILSPTPALSDLANRIQVGLSDWNLNLWRITLFSGIGCASEGIRLGELMVMESEGDCDRRREALHGLGRAMFHGGYYRLAADSYQEASAIASRSGDQAMWTAMELQLMEAERCAGYWQSAWNRANQMEDSIRDPWLQAMLMLRRVLILGQRYQLLSLFGVKKSSRGVREQSKHLLTRIIAIASERGAWLELQQCKMWSERLGIDFRDLYDGPLQPLPSEKGYRQLGYFVAVSMALRRSLNEQPRLVSNCTLKHTLETAWELGAWPELWKLTWMVMRKRRWKALNIRRILRGIQAWLKCQYTLAMRVQLTLRP
jgi:hypothetical protein